jgi:hypothetical protein
MIARNDEGSHRNGEERATSAEREAAGRAGMAMGSALVGGGVWRAVGLGLGTVRV